MLARNIRVEADLVDQLFNSTEKRLARTLLLLARCGTPGNPQRGLPKVSQEMLAEIIGTTRSRVNLFMNKFKKLGFVTCDGEIHINDSLLSVVLHDYYFPRHAKNPPKHDHVPKRTDIQSRLFHNGVCGTFVLSSAGEA